MKTRATKRGNMKTSNVSFNTFDPWILAKVRQHVHKAGGKKVKFKTINYHYKLKTPSPKAQQQVQENTRNGTESKHKRNF